MQKPKKPRKPTINKRPVWKEPKKRKIVVEAEISCYSDGNLQEMLDSYIKIHQAEFDMKISLTDIRIISSWDHSECWICVPHTIFNENYQYEVDTLEMRKEIYRRKLEKWKLKKPIHDKKMEKYREDLAKYEVELKKYHDYLDRRKRENRLKEYEKLKKEFSEES